MKLACLHFAKGFLTQLNPVTSTIALIACSFSFWSNGAAIAQPVTDLEPEIGTIKQMQQGDLMCYVKFVDAAGVERTTGATFELCQRSRQYLQRQVRMVYGVRSVNDCTSNEPCGKTKRTNLVVRMDVVNAAQAAPNSMVLQNQNWKITVGGRNSWSGVNGTGNLTYRGCNTKQECLSLKGGTMTCRNGVCATTWRNKNYTYSLLSPITDGSTNPASTLVIRRNGTVLQEITGLR